MNVLFPDRKLYLFDTFEGFVPQQIRDEFDNAKQTREWIDSLKDTAEEIVWKKMRYQDQVIVKKGLFPESARGINEKFAFVNLDMDLYKPTYEGLMFFWDRLNPGGYIFVHDFDNWDGIRASVMQFCKEKSAGYVCLNDGITVCIPKPMS